MASSRRCCGLRLAGARPSPRAAASSSSDARPSSSEACRRTIGKGEGKLNLIAWEGYTQPEWVKPFEQQTGCQVNAKYAGSSDEMVTLMRQGGGGAVRHGVGVRRRDLRLIYGGDVQPVNVDLIPAWKDFLP